MTTSIHERVDNLGLQFQTDVGIVTKKFYQITTVSGNSFKSEGICKFPGPYTVAGGYIRRKSLAQLIKQIILVGPDLKHIVLKIGLQDTVGTGHGATFADVDDPVSATMVVTGPGTEAQEFALVFFKIERLLAAQFPMGKTIRIDYFYRKVGAYAKAPSQ